MAGASGVWMDSPIMGLLMLEHESPYVLQVRDDVMSLVTEFLFYKVRAGFYDEANALSDVFGPVADMASIYATGEEFDVI